MPFSAYGWAILFVLLSACSRSSSPNGQVLFANACARCHGMDGSGNSGMQTDVRVRNLRDHTFQANTSDDELKKMIRQGKPPHMPAFGGVFQDKEIEAIVVHIRSFDR